MVRVVFSTDSLFSNARNLRRQLGYVLLMVYKYDRYNIVDYASNRCKREARCFIVSGAHSRVAWFDFSYVVRHMTEETQGHTMDLGTYVDSLTLFNFITKECWTAERRLNIDILALKESFAQGQLWCIVYISEKSNPTDALIKQVLSKSTPLRFLMWNNYCLMKPTE